MAFCARRLLDGETELLRRYLHETVNDVMGTRSNRADQLQVHIGGRLG